MPEKQREIEINSDFKKAVELLENSEKNVFLTGRAGTGKSTFLEYYRNITSKNMVVLAPTGVAALNVRGETIHSFFNFKPDITLEKVRKFSAERRETYKKLELIIIDEVSMVRSDLMDCVDRFLRLNGKKSKKPFGGVQMVFIGDLYQLPPVVTSSEREIFKTMYRSPYFFSAKVFEELEMEFVEFEKVYRQKDPVFIGLLNRIRNNTAGRAELFELNKRVGVKLPKEARQVYLTTTNAMAEGMNRRELEKLKGRPFVFNAESDGKVEKSRFPADEELCIKEGAQVMMLNNESSGRWVNGTIAKVAGAEQDSEGGKPVIIIELADGSIEEVRQCTWDVFHYYYDKGRNSIESSVIGSFTQYPMKLAWAITIHKSQGKTFDNVTVDLGRGTFAHGQLYVALSRCTALSGLSLKQPVRREDVRMDWRVGDFITKYRYALSERDQPASEKAGIIEGAIESGNCLEIVYLKRDDEKTKRRIKPLELGPMQYEGTIFPGVRAF
ncbi:MAG: DEAD/DEAH box helicase, partial [Candidatus Firestonebacteria bacterium]